MLGILIGNTIDHTITFYMCQRIHDSPTPPTPTLQVAALQLQHHHNLLSLFSTDRPTDAELHNTTLVLSLCNSRITIICFFCSPKIDRRKAPQSNTSSVAALQLQHHHNLLFLFSTQSSTIQHSCCVQSANPSWSLLAIYKP